MHNAYTHVAKLGLKMAQLLALGYYDDSLHSLILDMGIAA